MKALPKALVTTWSEERAPAATAYGGVSVVVPALNEERAVGPCLRGLHRVFASTDHPYELIVVDDGSSDSTADVARGEGAKVWTLSENRGYGAALKAGVAHATYDTIVIIDADGTYPPESIPDLLSRARQFDMVVGARTPRTAAIPRERRPAKWFLGRLASYLAGRPIPDLNSGLRVMHRDLVRRFEHLLPSGFSFTTTITLAALCNDYAVDYHPIDYRVRIGRSKIRPTHALEFLILVLRTVVYFNPLKVFLPVGGLFFVVGFSKFLYDLTLGNVSESAVMGLLSAGILWGFGLLADQMSRIAAQLGPSRS